MGSVRIVKIDGVSWLEVDGLLLHIQDDQLLVRHDNVTQIVPCEVVHENTNVVPFNKGE